MNTRKIEQINSFVNPKTGWSQIVALAEDGSLWVLSLKDDDDLDWKVSVTDVDWVPLPALPATQ